MLRIWTATAAAVVLALAISAPVRAGSVHTDVPEQVNPDTKYLIYLHGAWPETHALDTPHSTRGLFQYDNILAALAEAGFEVISEHRKEKTNPRRYAREKTSERIKALVSRGVPPENITIVGYSKGGQIALLAATFARQSGMNLVSLAGCEKAPLRPNYDRFLANDAAKLQGRMLSIFDKQDNISGTCKEISEKSPNLKFEEFVIELGAGHGAFYAPDPVWVDMIANWANPAPEPKG